jgi:LPS export ABC transporter protein LptC
MQRLTLLLIPGLIAIALFFGLSIIETVSTDSDVESEFSTLDFDAFSEGINSVLYDDNGAINYTLQAISQVHFNDDHTEFEKPFIRLFQDGNSRWNIVANSGRISAGLSESDSSIRTIELSGDVEVYSLDAYGNRTVISTEFLSVDPQLETLETDQPVTLVTTNIRQSSIGMFANLNTDEIVFHQDIQGSYEQTAN